MTKVMPRTRNKYRLGADALIARLRRVGLAVTRKNYIYASYGSTRPEPWTAENEMHLPEELQDWSLFKLVDGELQYRFKTVKQPGDGFIIPGAKR
jgi:hypothetical protein